MPSHFYSFSFALNPNWSQAFALQPEIHQYFVNLAQQYRIHPHTRLNTAVERAIWDASTGTRLVTVRNQHTKETSALRCKILISAVGSLSVPKDCDIPGASSFTGPLFHSARWDHSFDYTNKDIVVIGNGCSATQFVPILANTAHHVTQFSRQPHWLAPRPNPVYSTSFKVLMRYLPLAMRLYRWSLFLAKEAEFATFATHSGAPARDKAAAEQAAYIRAHAPAKYADALVPTTVLGCKRKVMDTSYLACLHAPNVSLQHADPVARITPDGVETRSGASIRADAIVLANGFKTQQPLFPMEVRGEGGVSLEEHWREANDGSPCAYLGTMVSGFPNFFVLMGPNTVTGHLSVLFTTECQINYVNRLIAPILGALRPGRFRAREVLGLGPAADVVAVREEAERREVEWVGEKTKGLVWATGCSSWGIDERTGKNTMLYPDWQVKFWLRSLWPVGRDLAYVRSEEAVEKARKRRSVWPRFVVLAALVALVVGGRRAVELGYARRLVGVLREVIAGGAGFVKDAVPQSVKRWRRSLLVAVR